MLSKFLTGGCSRVRVGLCSQGTRDGMTPVVPRGGLGWILRWRMWSGTGTGCPWKWRNHHPWNCSGNAWMWRLETRASGRLDSLILEGFPSFYNSVTDEVTAGSGCCGCRGSAVPSGDTALSPRDWRSLSPPVCCRVTSRGSGGGGCCSGCSLLLPSALPCRRNRWPEWGNKSRDFLVWGPTRPPSSSSLFRRLLLLQRDSSCSVPPVDGPGLLLEPLPMTFPAAEPGFLSSRFQMCSRQGCPNRFE